MDNWSSSDALGMGYADECELTQAPIPIKGVKVPL